MKCESPRKINKIAVTGATSPIGTALISECLKSDIEVMAFINPDSPRRENVPVSSKVRVIECGLENFGNCEPGEEADAFVHLAWSSTAGAAARNNLEAQAKNIGYSLDAVHLAKKMNCRVFLGAGSQAEYGRTKETLTEETEPLPETGYGIAKLCAGQLTRLACRQEGIEHIWTRILSAYGEYCNPNTVLNYTLLELLNGRTPLLTAGEQIWDFIYVGDVARAILAVLNLGGDGETYVIGSGSSKPLREFLLAAGELVNKDITLGLGAKPYPDQAVMHLSCDISKLKTDTGFAPEISFEEGILRTVSWLKEQEKIGERDDGFKLL